MAEHPPADASKLLAQLEEWERGDITPGMALSNLKKGGLASLFDGLGLDAAAVAVWTRWEKGAVNPAEVLEALRDGGLRDRLQAATP